MCGLLHTRAAEIFGGFCRQTPPLSFTQNVAAYQFLGLQNFILPRPESLEVGHFKANMQIKWPTPKLSGRGKTVTYGPKNWYAVTFWVKLNGGICLQNPPKILAALLVRVVKMVWVVKMVRVVQVVRLVRVVWVVNFKNVKKFQKISKNFEKFQKIQNISKISKDFKNFKNFQKFQKFQKISKISKNFNVLWLPSIPQHLIILKLDAKDAKSS